MVPRPHTQRRSVAYHSLQTQLIYRPPGSFSLQSGRGSSDAQNMIMSRIGGAALSPPRRPKFPLIRVRKADRPRLRSRSVFSVRSSSISYNSLFIGKTGGRKGPSLFSPLHVRIRPYFWDGLEAAHFERAQERAHRVAQGGGTRPIRRCAQRPCSLPDGGFGLPRAGARSRRYRLSLQARLRRKGGCMLIAGRKAAASPTVGLIPPPSEGMRLTVGLPAPLSDGSRRTTLNDRSRRSSSSSSSSPSSSSVFALSSFASVLGNLNRKHPRGGGGRVFLPQGQTRRRPFAHDPPPARYAWDGAMFSSRSSSLLTRRRARVGPQMIRRRAFLQVTFTVRSPPLIRMDVRRLLSAIEAVEDLGVDFVWSTGQVIVGDSLQAGIGIAASVPPSIKAGAFASRQVSLLIHPQRWALKRGLRPRRPPTAKARNSSATKNKTRVEPILAPLLVLFALLLKPSRPSAAIYRGRRRSGRALALERRQSRRPVLVFTSGVRSVRRTRDPVRYFGRQVSLVLLLGPSVTAACSSSTPKPTSSGLQESDADAAVTPDAGTSITTDLLSSECRNCTETHNVIINLVPNRTHPQSTDLRILSLQKIDDVLWEPASATYRAAIDINPAECLAVTTATVDFVAMSIANNDTAWDILRIIARDTKGLFRNQPNLLAGCVPFRETLVIMDGQTMWKDDVRRHRRWAIFSPATWQSIRTAFWGMVRYAQRAPPHALLCWPKMHTQRSLIYPLG